MYRRKYPVILMVNLGVLLMAVLTGCQTITAHPPAPTELDQPGSFAVETFDTRLRNHHGDYPATVYYPAPSPDEKPAANTARRSRTTSRSYPIIAVSPGLRSRKEYNRWIGAHTAGHGYIVIIFTVPEPEILSTSQQQAGFISGLRYLTAANRNPDSPIYQHADVKRRGIIGHSLGAMASLDLAGKPASELDAVIALAPAAVDPAVLRQISAPTQLQAAERDCITYPEPVLENYRHLGTGVPDTIQDGIGRGGPVAASASPKQTFSIVGGNHVGFNDEDSPAYRLGRLFVDCKNTIEITDHQQRISRRMLTAWLDFFLKDDATAAAYLSGDHIKQLEQQGFITDVRSSGLEK